LSAQLARSGVGESPRQTSVTDHPGYVELLNHDRAVVIGECRGQFVERIPTYVGGAGVHPSQL
jgi:hypothetical protein